MRTTEPLIGSEQYIPRVKSHLDPSGSGLNINLLPKSIRHVQDIVQDRDVESVLEKLFHLKRRGTTAQMEFFCGFVQFVSCMYVLPVVPSQLSRAGFDETKTVVVTVSKRALCCSYAVHPILVDLSSFQFVFTGCCLRYWVSDIWVIC